MVTLLIADILNALTPTAVHRCAGALAFAHRLLLRHVANQSTTSASGKAEVYFAGNRLLFMGRRDNFFPPADLPPRWIPR